MEDDLRAMTVTSFGFRASTQPMAGAIALAKYLWQRFIFRS